MFGLSRAGKGKPPDPPDKGKHAAQKPQASQGPDASAEATDTTADSPSSRVRNYALGLEDALLLRPELERHGLAHELWYEPGPDGSWLGPLWLSLPRPPRNWPSAWLRDWLQERRGRRPAQARRVDWQDLPGLDLCASSDRRLGSVVLILSPDRTGLQRLMAEHVRLGEGELAVACQEGLENTATSNWLLQLHQPSYWLLAQAPTGRVFLASERPGLYIEQGYAPRHPRLLELLRWDNRHLLLLEGSGTLRELAVTWQPVRGLIELELPAPARFSPAPEFRLRIRPRLVAAAGSGPARLWRIAAAAHLEALLAEAAPEQLSCFRCFISPAGEVFLEMSGNYGDAGLAEALSRQFPAWQLLQRRVFVPAGLRLQPRLSEEELQRSLPALQRQDRLCLTATDDRADDRGAHASFGLVLLPAKGWQELGRLIEHRVEAALEQLPEFISSWDFELGELVERSRQQVFALRGEPGTKPAAGPAPATQAGSPALEAEPEPDSIPDFAPAVRSEQTLALRQAVRELDERLLEHFSDAALWRERAGLCERLKASKEALYSRALAAVIERDSLGLLGLIASTYPLLAPGLETLFAHEPLDEAAKGALLSQLRQGQPCAEDRYLLQLWYACRFGDADVFALTVEAMRRGESVPEAPFHDFGLSDESGGGSQILMLDFSDAEALSAAIARYGQMLRDCEPDLRAVALEQFRVLLKAHHPQPAQIDALLPRPAFPSRARALWARKWAELLAWPEPFARAEGSAETTGEAPSRAAAFWAGRITLPGLQGARLQELFTGEAYRPDFTAEFRDEALAEVEKIYRSYLQKDAPAADTRKARAQTQKAPAPTYWQDVFIPAASELARGRQQRTLLYLCQRYGPLGDFEPFVATPDYRHLTEFSCFVRHCDGFRLSRLFEQNLDETVFFPQMIEGLDRMARTNLIDFRDAAENLVSCLFLSRSAHRGDWLAIVLHLILREAERHAGRADSERGDELLATLVHLELEPLLANLSRGLENYQHALRRRALWMEHAHRLHHEGLGALSEAYSSLAAQRQPQHTDAPIEEKEA